LQASPPVAAVAAVGPASDRAVYVLAFSELLSALIAICHCVTAGDLLLLLSVLLIDQRPRGRQLGAKDLACCCSWQVIELQVYGWTGGRYKARQQHVPAAAAAMPHQLLQLTDHCCSWLLPLLQM